MRKSESFESFQNFQRQLEVTERDFKNHVSWLKVFHDLHLLELRREFHNTQQARDLMLKKMMKALIMIIVALMAKILFW